MRLCLAKSILCHISLMQFSATQIALLINGKVEGNADATVHSFGKIEEAQNGQLAFLANPKYEDHLYSTNASIVIVNESLELKKTVNATLVRVPDAYSAFAILLDKYQQLQTQQLKGIQQPSFIHDSAKVGNDVLVSAFSYISAKASIADNVKIFPQVFIGEFI